MEQTIEQKRYFEISQAQILKFMHYRKLLFCVFQQNLNKPESFEDFKRLWWSSIRYMMEKEKHSLHMTTGKNLLLEIPK